MNFNVLRTIWTLIGRVFPKISVPSYVGYNINKRLTLQRNVTIIDLGCGDGARFSVLKRLLNDRHFSIGVDIFFPRLKKAKEVYDEVVLCNALHLPIEISQSKIVLVLDLVEHLYKEDAMQLIRLLDSAFVLILSTPNGFQPRGVVRGNPYEVHKCGFQVIDLKKLGFEVYGLWGLKNITSLFRVRNLSFPPNIIVGLARMMSQMILEMSKRVELSSSLIAIKQNRGSDI